MTSADLREAQSALRSGFTLIRLEGPEHLVGLVDALERQMESFVEVAYCLSKALDVAEARMEVLRAASRYAPRHDDSAPLPGETSTRGNTVSRGALQLVKDVYDGESVA